MKRTKDEHLVAFENEINADNVERQDEGKTDMSNLNHREMSHWRIVGTVQHFRSDAIAH